MCVKRSVPDSTAWIILLMIAVGVISQALALIRWGHSTYLWVQGVEAAAAAVVLLGFGICYRRHDSRASRWPPLMPLAAIAGFGAAKDIFVATSSETPVWLVALLLGSVAWFLVSSTLIWHTEGQARATSRRDGGTD